jgi:hypothetical protein
MTKINILLSADDEVIIADNAGDLQRYTKVKC